LSIDCGIKNVRQDCIIGSVCGVLVREGRANGGDEGEGIWLMNFIYKIEQ
jgi:hypothetical protein